MSSIEWISKDQKVLAIAIRGDYVPAKTEFVSPENFSQQLGFIVYAKGETITPHWHRKIQRVIEDSSETLMIKKGKVEVHIFTENQELVKKLILNEGDIICLICGGHGFKMLENSIIVEVKQGPYLGVNEKVRFGWSTNDTSQ